MLKRSGCPQALLTPLLVACLGVMNTLASAGLPVVIGDVRLQDNKNVVLGFPSGGSPKNHVFISRRQYLINWSTTLRSPRWVSWILNKRTLGDAARTNVFHLDEDLSTYLWDRNVLPVAPEEYRGSCVDRGHQVASGDRTASIPDNQATFIMSNIAPQSAYLNRKIWVSLERFLRTAVLEKGKEIYVISGVSGPSLGKIGLNGDISVQSKNYKVAVIKQAGNSNVPLEDMRLLVVEMPNMTSTGTNPVIDQDQACYDSEHMMRIEENNRMPYWRSYQKDLSEIELSSGLSFSHLYGIPLMTDDEIGEIAATDVDRGFDSLSLLQIVRNAVQSIP
ncbi:MAG: DNA/RNA non-specific endonuclease [Proteobacteria bacterium]|nr:DNA/RNA non-specific endonuclease [Pseudomonadota bacterium]